MTETQISQPKISCKNLWKVFGPSPRHALSVVTDTMNKEEILDQTGHVIAIRNVSFDILEGEVFMIMGLSGSGKSTLARCLNGLIKPTRGQVLLDGIDLATMNEAELRMARRHKVSMVFQHFALFPHRSILENAAYGLELQGLDKGLRQKKAREVLDLVGLRGWENSYPDELSGGMQQRVGLARALALDPEILIMDEPFSALDPLIRRQMQDEFISLVAKVRKTIVFISHDLNEALKLGTKVAIMKDGEIVQLGTPEEIVSAPSNEYVAQFVCDVSHDKVLPVRSIMRKPELKLYASQKLRAALQVMEVKGIDQAFVVNSQDRLMGVIKADDISQALTRNCTTLDEITIERAPMVGPDQPIAEVTPLTAACDNTVAVVDGDEKLIGEVPRVVLLRALAGKENPHGTV